MSDPVATSGVIAQIIAGAGGAGAFGVVVGRELINWLRKRAEAKDETTVVNGGNGKACPLHDEFAARIEASVEKLGEKMDKVKDAVVDEGRKSGERLARLEERQEGTQTQVTSIFERLNRREP